MTVRWGLIGASTIAKEWMIGAIREAGGSAVAAAGNVAKRADVRAMIDACVEEFGGLGRNRVQGDVAAGCGQDMREQRFPQRERARIGAQVAGCGLLEQPDHRRRPTSSRRDLRCLAAGA